MYANVLLFGPDPLLLKTRQQLLKTVGIKAAVKHSVLLTSDDLKCTPCLVVVACHDVPLSLLAGLLAQVHSCGAAATFAVIRLSLQSLALPAEVDAELPCEPRAFIRGVQQLAARCLPVATAPQSMSATA